MQRSRIGYWGILATTSMLAACGTAPTRGAASEQFRTEQTAETGLALRAAASRVGDVEAVHYDVTRIACNGESFESFSKAVDVPLQASTLLDSVSSFAGKPLESASHHTFADSFLVVPIGCYSVVATPMRHGGTPSAECSAAEKRGVRVVDGETTEIVLLSQCQGDPKGSLDTVVALNHPPSVESLSFAGSKFGDRCAPMHVCATVKDSDGDSVELVWDRPSSPPDLPWAGPLAATTTRTTAEGLLTECVEFIPQAAGQYRGQVTVYDRVIADDGSTQRTEGWLASQGNVVSSHDVQGFVFFASDRGRVPAPEVCNGVDDDCDGVVDENADVACSTACGVGTQTCANGRLEACGAPEPKEEVCNGRDDNCDGVIDEHLTRSCATACGAGIETCQQGTFGACSAPTPKRELCNEIDDDCNGIIDDKCVIAVELRGDCGTVSCPLSAPYPVGCDAVVFGGEGDQGCVSNPPLSSDVFFKAGTQCSSGTITGSLYCSVIPGDGLNATNCPTNRARTTYPTQRIMCAGE